MGLTITLSAALMLGAGVFILCRYAGLKICARRGVRHIRVLPRVVQPRAGHREHHGQPVPAALAKHHRNDAEKGAETVNVRSDVSRATSAGHEKGRL